jgi:hypothetical protein
MTDWFIIVGIFGISFFLTFVTVYMARRWWSCPIRTEACVVEILVCEDSERGRMYQSVLEFTVDRVTYHIRDEVLSFPAMNEVGDHIWLWRSATDPQRIVTPTFISWMLALAFMSCMAWGLFAFLFWARFG